MNNYILQAFEHLDGMLRKEMKKEPREVVTFMVHDLSTFY